MIKPYKKSNKKGLGNISTAVHKRKVLSFTWKQKHYDSGYKQKNIFIAFFCNDSLNSRFTNNCLHAFHEWLGAS